MPEITLHSPAGEAVDKVQLADAIFGAEVRTDLVHAAVVAQLAAKRTGTHQARTRGEVSGGGKKPYRQKGTGRARQGSTRATQWVGGGVAHPPVPRDYTKRLNRKVRRQALCSVWSDHAAAGSLIVCDSLGLTEPRTKLAAAALRALLAPVADRLAAATEPPPARPEDDPRPVRRRKVRAHALVMLGPEELEAGRRALGNLATVSFDYEQKITVIFAVRAVPAPYASVYDLALADAVVASRGALERVTAEFAGQEA